MFYEECPDTKELHFIEIQVSYGIRDEKDKLNNSIAIYIVKKSLQINKVKSPKTESEISNSYSN